MLQPPPENATISNHPQKGEKMNATSINETDKRQTAFTFATVKQPREAIPVFGDHFESFEAYHRRYPQVYAALVAAALKMLRRGRKAYSMKAIIEGARWEMALNVDEGEAFKINNNHSPYYARFIMATVPELSGFFKVRKSAADEVIK